MSYRYIDFIEESILSLEKAALKRSRNQHVRVIRQVALACVSVVLPPYFWIRLRQNKP